MNIQKIVTHTKRYSKKEEQPLCSWHDWRDYKNTGRVSKGKIFRIRPEPALEPIQLPIQWIPGLSRG